MPFSLASLSCLFSCCVFTPVNAISLIKDVAAVAVDVAALPVDVDTSVVAEAVLVFAHGILFFGNCSLSVSDGVHVSFFITSSFFSSLLAFNLLSTFALQFL